MRVGLYDHFGWAVAVTASADHRVVDRRRIELVEPGLVAAPIHYEGPAHDDAGLAALVADVRASIVRATAAAFEELTAALPEPVASVSLRHWPADFPQEIEVQRRVPWESRADAVMYRQVVADVAAERGWTLHVYDAKHVEAQASAVLGTRAHEVLHCPRQALGPPWTKDHRVALAATVLAG